MEERKKNEMRRKGIRRNKKIRWDFEIKQTTRKGIKREKERRS